MNFWNDLYWKKHLEEHKDERLDFLNDFWVDKYAYIIDKIPKENCLDLGCGLGQYTKYFSDNGFTVTAADISEIALENVKKNNPNTKTIVLDMSKKLPFLDNSFDLVFANLSIHYFDTKTTIFLLKEIKRILKNDGYFIGSVNSDKTFKFLKESKKIEDNFYQENERFVRLWNQDQFNNFFKDYIKLELNEITTTRWNKTKIMWQFIYQIKK